jgi:glycyl-tRNA synthetase beta chain
VPETAEFLLELGCEEMPAPWLPGLTAQLRERFSEGASRERLYPDDVQAFSTPRRFVLRAQVRRRQDDREETVFGPALKVAKNADGAWSAAAVGFARKSGVSPDALGQGPKDPARPDEKHLLFVKKVAGRGAGEVVVGLLPALLRGLAFPKRMSWDAWLDDGKGAFPFGRPIRWMVALLGGQVLPCDIHELVAGGKGPVIVHAGDVTYGHRFLPRGSAGGPIRVTSFADLESKLEGAAVVLRAERRRQTIESALRAAGPVEDDHGLVDEWQDLVEHPAVVIGQVPSEFRSLPREVLETVLVHHQKYVPLLESGSVVRFAAVTNSDGKAAAPIVRNMERVVVARLRDAAFFWKEDRKRPLADRVSDLGGVTFHQGLGSYLDKTNRMVALVEAVGQEVALAGATLESARLAARLAKADLTTAMVREFPELQGVMGSLYLEAEKSAPPEVAAAVRWHYHPVSVEQEALPAGKLSPQALLVFAVLSLADKLDTLAGYFGLELEPTGSSDPFGLRRAGQGLLRVLVDFWPPGSRTPSLSALLPGAVLGYGSALERPAEKTVASLRQFLLGRLEYLLEARGYPPEEVAAVVYTPAMEALTDVRDCFERLRALHRGRERARADFERLATVFKRAKNILTQDGGSAGVDSALFDSPAERDLFQAVQGLSARSYSGYDDRMKALVTLREPVDRFFDDVLVMAEDPNVRGNRLALLHRTLSLFYRIADISRLGGQA